MSERREKSCNTPRERHSLLNCSAVEDTVEELLSKMTTLDAAASEYVVENSL